MSHAKKIRARRNVGSVKKVGRLVLSRRWPLLLFFAVGGMRLQSSAALIYWDSDGATPGGSSGTTATGTWGSASASAFWSAAADGSAATTATWASTDTAVFSAGTDVT